MLKPVTAIWVLEILVLSRITKKRSLKQKRNLEVTRRWEKNENKTQKPSGEKRVRKKYFTHEDWPCGRQLKVNPSKETWRVGSYIQVPHSQNIRFGETEEVDTGREFEREGKLDKEIRVVIANCKKYADNKEMIFTFKLFFLTTRPY